METETVDASTSGGSPTSHVTRVVSHPVGAKPGTTTQSPTYAANLNGKTKNANTRLSPLAVEIVPDEGMAGVVGDMIPSSKGPAWEKHFVTPKKPANNPDIPNDYVILKANGVTAEEFQRLFKWEGGGSEITGEPLKYRIPRSAANKYEAKIVAKSNATLVAKMNVWAVWCDVAPAAGVGYLSDEPSPWLSYAVPAAPVFDGTPPKCWRFVFTIQPAKIVSPTADRPMLEGDRHKPVPGERKLWPVNSHKLADTAITRWDVSRQMRVKIKNPDLIPIQALMQDGLPEYYSKDQPKAENIPVSFPINAVEGNDDHDSEKENDGNPYRSRTGKGLDHGVGQISSADAPASLALDAWANPGPGRSFADLTNFREFARIELWDGQREGGTFWFRISEHIEWRFDFTATWHSDEWRAAPPTETELGNNP